MSIKLAEYDNFVRDTSVWNDPVYPMLGLAGESGEVIDAIKKIWREHGPMWAENCTDEQRMEIIRELGDVQWYITRLLHILDSDLDEMVKENISKLAQRGRVPNVISMRPVEQSWDGIPRIVE